MAEATEIQMHEEFYIGSNPDEDIVSIPKPELHRLQDDLHHLHGENLELTKQNLALTMLIHDSWHARVAPLKAPLEEVCKLTTQSLLYYIASFKMSPTLPTSRDTRVKYLSKVGFCDELERQGVLVADRRGSEAIFINTYCLQK